MAGVSTPVMAAAVTNSGGLGSIAIGDGWVLLKDVLFRVPPKGGPLRDVLERAVHATPRAALEAHLERGLSDELETIHRLMAAVERRERG